MDALTRIESIAAVLPDANIDTDIIFPARFLLLTSRTGLGTHLFQDRRTRADGSEDPGFPLNRPAWRGAEILVAGENFGCGSSREQAVWALADRGLRVVIAPSFGEIFFANCFRNAMLPIVLDAPTMEVVRQAAEHGGTIVVDLRATSITMPDGATITFAIEPNRCEALLHGWDETAQILNRDLGHIAAFEARQRDALPWLHEGEANDVR